MQSGNYENIYDDNRELSVHSYMRRTTRREWLREVFFFENKVNAFGIRRSKEPDLFNYLTNTFNIPDSDKGFIEVEL